MFDKINPKLIIIDHLKTLTNNRTGKPMKTDFFLFFGIPIVVAFVFLCLLRIELDGNSVGILTTSLSIFAALLFNLLLLVYDVVRKEENNPLRHEALKQIFANISFSIFVSIVAVFLLMIDFLFDSFFEKWYFAIGVGVDFVIYWFISLFTLTLLMILKRIHILLSKEFD